MDIDTTLLSKYGWTVFIAFYLVRELLPLAIKYFNRNQESQADKEAKARDKAAREHTLDLDRRWELENRSVRAIEKIATNAEQQTGIMTALETIIKTMNQRLERLEAESAAILRGVEVLLDRQTRGVEEESPTQPAPEAGQPVDPAKKHNTRPRRTGGRPIGL